LRKQRKTLKGYFFAAFCSYYKNLKHRIDLHCVPENSNSLLFLRHLANMRRCC